MKGNDCWVVFHPSWLNKTLEFPSASDCTSKETIVSIHSGGPARQRHTTRSLGVSSVTSKSNVIGASGNETFTLDPRPFGPSVWLLHHPFTPSDVATVS